MKKHISYPKIGQFRNVVSTIKRQSTFVELDEDGKAIYDDSKSRPLVRFRGTVKLHGTNAGVSFNNTDGIWFQSRNNIITIEKDNADFAKFANVRSELFESMIRFVAEKHEINLDENTLTLYGEWAGKGIQKGVGISEVERAFYIFGVKCTPFNEDLDAYWIDTEKLLLSDIKSGVFDINGFPTFSITIDFNEPENIQNKLIAITEAIEENCPVAKTFGIDGIGEGVVWTGIFDGTWHRFKVKGEKHSVSKVKKLASVDVEKIKNVKSFVEYSVTDQRFEQALQMTFPTRADIDVTKLGNVIRWVINDIANEEYDTLEKNGLTSKDVNSAIAAEVKKRFFAMN